MSAQNRDRGFLPEQPAFCTMQFRFRDDLAKHRALKDYAAQLFYRLAKSRKVQVHAYCFLDNHIHTVVSQPFKDHDKKRQKGIAYFLQHFQQRLSRQMNVIDTVEGGKFVDRYHSVNLVTLEHYVNKMAYTVAQALNHGVEPDELLASDEILRGDANPIITQLPRIYRPERGQTRKQMAEQLGQVLQATVDNYRALQQGRQLDPARRYSRNSARAKAMRKARIRRNAAQVERQARRMRRHTPNYRHWEEAAQMALWQAGLDSETLTAGLPRFRVEPLDPDRFATEQQRLKTWVFPKMTNHHTFDERNRITSTTLSAPGYDDATIHWPHRIPRDWHAPQP